MTSVLQCIGNKYQITHYSENITNHCYILIYTDMLSIYVHGDWCYVGGGSGAANSPISSVLSMLKSGPNESHIGDMSSGTQGVFSQLLALKSQLIDHTENVANGGQVDSGAVNNIQSQLNQLTAQNIPNAVNQAGVQGQPEEHALNGLVSQVQAGITHLTSNQGGQQGQQQGQDQYQQQGQDQYQQGQDQYQQGQDNNY